MQRVAFILVFALTVGASIVSTVWGSRNPQPLKPWAYPYFWLPVLFASLPYRWPRRAGLSAGLLVAYVFSPLSLSIGILFVPAAIAMAVVWYIGRPKGGYPGLPPPLPRK